MPVIVAGAVWEMGNSYAGLNLNTMSSSPLTVPNAHNKPNSKRAMSSTI